MDAETDYEIWTLERFSQANPLGPGQDDVCALLTRVADTIRSLGSIQVQDTVFHNEITPDGREWPSMTVYFQRGLDETEAETADVSPIEVPNPLELHKQAKDVDPDGPAETEEAAPAETSAVTTG